MSRSPSNEIRNYKYGSFASYSSSSSIITYAFYDFIEIFRGGCFMEEEQLLPNLKRKVFWEIENLTVHVIFR